MRWASLNKILLTQRGSDLFATVVLKIYRCSSVGRFDMFVARNAFFDGVLNCDQDTSLGVRRFLRYRVVDRLSALLHLTFSS